MQQSNRDKYLPWIVCLSASLFFFYEFFQINMLNALSSGITQSLAPTATELGTLSACYFYGNVIGLFPAGLLLDRFSTRRLILIAMSLSIIGTFLFSLSNALVPMSVGRFLSGLAGGSFCFLSTVRLTSRWFPPQRMAFMLGVIVTIATLGGVLAQAPLTALLSVVTWQKAVILQAMVGILILGIISLSVKDMPKTFLPLDNYKHKINFWLTLKTAVSNPQNWLGGLYASLLNLPILVLGALWGSLYLTQMHGLSKIEASYVTMMLYIGMIIGSPAVGFFSDAIGRRLFPMLIGAVVSLALILSVYFMKLGVNQLLILFFLLGFFSSVQTLGYSFVAENNPISITASAVGFATVIIMSGGAIFQPLFGWLMSLNWGGAMENGVPLYSIEDYNLAMQILPVAAIISILCLLFMRNTQSKSLFIRLLSTNFYKK
ncbi:MAG: MFS transporter [Gammaproteobacteria bacterium]